jgi:hypothetical protein
VITGDDDDFAMQVFDTPAVFVGIVSRQSSRALGDLRRPVFEESVGKFDSQLPLASGLPADEFGTIGGRCLSRPAGFDAPRSPRSTTPLLRRSDRTWQRSGRHHFLNAHIGPGGLHRDRRDFCGDLRSLHQLSVYRQSFNRCRCSLFWNWRWSNGGLCCCAHFLAGGRQTIGNRFRRRRGRIPSSEAIEYEARRCQESAQQRTDPKPAARLRLTLR